MRGFLPKTGGNPQRILEKLNRLQAVGGLYGPNRRTSQLPMVEGHPKQKKPRAIGARQFDRQESAT